MHSIAAVSATSTTGQLGPWWWLTPLLAGVGALLGAGFTGVIAYLNESRKLTTASKQTQREETKQMGGVILRHGSDVRLYGANPAKLQGSVEDFAREYAAGDLVFTERTQRASSDFFDAVLAHIGRISAGQVRDVVDYENFYQAECRFRDALRVDLGYQPLGDLSRPGPDVAKPTAP